MQVFHSSIFNSVCPVRRLVNKLSFLIQQNIFADGVTHKNVVVDIVVDIPTNMMQTGVEKCLCNNSKIPVRLLMAILVNCNVRMATNKLFLHVAKNIF